ncbi:MAG TPA: hypothetical protein VE440_06300, partial [Gaiellaceae bacterium]|nr:hypothetical protein [Gaiellaceae bacterium]
MKLRLPARQPRLAMAFVAIIALAAGAEAAAKDRTVTTDGPGGQPLGNAPQSQGPADALAELASTVEGFDAGRNPENLRNFLASAEHHLAKGRVGQACDAVAHFSRRVAKESGGTLTEAEAGQLEAG